MKRSNKKKTSTSSSKLATPTSSKNLSSILSSNNQGGGSNKNVKKDAQSVVTTKTSATLQSLYAKAKHQDVDQLFQDLLGDDDDDDDDDKTKEENEDNKSGGLGAGGSSIIDNDSSTAMSSLLPIVTTPIITSSSSGGGTAEKKKKGDMEGSSGGLMSVEDEVMRILNDTSKTTAAAAVAVAVAVAGTAATGTSKDEETRAKGENNDKRRGSSDTLQLSNHSKRIMDDHDLDDLCASTTNTGAEESKTKHSEASSMPWGDTEHEKEKTNKPIGEIFVYGDPNKNELKSRPSSTATKALTNSTDNNNNNNNEPRRHYRIAGSSNSISKKSTTGGTGTAGSTSSAYNRRPIRQRRTRGDNATLTSVSDGETCSVGSHGVSSILKSMGLGPEFSKTLTTKEELSLPSEDGTQGKDKPPSSSAAAAAAGPLSRHLASMMSQNIKNNKSTKTSVTTKNTTLKKKNRFLHRRQIRMLHLRAGMMILGLVSIMYCIVQFTAVLKHDKMAMQSLKGRTGGLHSHHSRHYNKHNNNGNSNSWNQHSGEHEEGIDRPLANLDILRKRASGGGGNLRGSNNERTPNEIALNLVKGKVPTKREGPVVDDNGGGVVRRKRSYDEIDNNLDTTTTEMGDALEDYNSEGAPPLEKYKGDEKFVQQQNLLPAEKELFNLMEQTLPKTYHYLSDVTKSSTQKKMEDIPLFWHIPRSGGTMVKVILTQCRGAVLASDAGRWSEEGTAKELKEISINGDTYLNVDMSTTVGIDRAKSLDVASSGMADAIITPYILKSTSLFDDKHHGLAFTMMRHPVERAASMYNYLKKNGNAEVKRLTIEEYAKSPHAENNWMVRFLTGKLGGEVTDDDLLVAKELLRTKFVVGLLEYKNSSMKRFEQYFGWKYTENPKEQYSCRKKAIEKNDKNGGGGDASTKIKEGTQAYSLLMWQNNLDMKLYLYAQHVFNLQGQELFPNLEANQ